MLRKPEDTSRVTLAETSPILPIVLPFLYDSDLHLEGVYEDRMVLVGSGTSPSQFSDFPTPFCKSWEFGYTKAFLVSGATRCICEQEKKAGTILTSGIQHKAGTQRTQFSPAHAWSSH